MRLFFQAKTNVLTFYRERIFRTGFTLIEVVLYVALFSTMSVMSMNMLFQAIQSFNALRIARDINDSSVGIIERLTRDVRSAAFIDLANSTFDIHPGRLTLNTVSASGTPLTVEYYVNGSTLHLKEDGVDKGSLMSAKTSIDALVFRYVDVGTTVGVKIELHLSSARGGVDAVDHFYDTVILRGSY